MVCGRALRACPLLGLVIYFPLGVISISVPNLRSPNSTVRPWFALSGIETSNGAITTSHKTRSVLMYTKPTDFLGSIPELQNKGPKCCVSPTDQEASPLKPLINAAAPADRHENDTTPTQSSGWDENWYGHVLLDSIVDTVLLMSRQVYFIDRRHPRPATARLARDLERSTPGSRPRPPSQVLHRRRRPMPSPPVGRRA